MNESNKMISVRQIIKKILWIVCVIYNVLLLLFVLFFGRSILYRSIIGQHVYNNDLYLSENIASIPGGDKAQSCFDEYSTVDDSKSFRFYYMDQSWKNFLTPGEVYGNEFVLDVNYREEEYKSYKIKILTNHNIESSPNVHIFNDDDYLIYDISLGSDKDRSEFWICFCDSMQRIRYIYLENPKKIQYFETISYFWRY